MGDVGLHRPVSYERVLSKLDSVVHLFCVLFVLLVHAVRKRQRLTILHLGASPLSQIVDPKDLMGVNPFTDYKSDGFPYCPNCGEDNLTSNLSMQTEQLFPQDVIERVYLHILSGMICMKCHWELLPGFLENGPSLRLKT